MELAKSKSAQAFWSSAVQGFAAERDQRGIAVADGLGLKDPVDG
jgi:hypothetical protein